MRSLLSGLGKVACSAAIIWFLMDRMDADALLPLLRGFDPAYGFLAVGCAMVSIAIQGERLALISGAFKPLSRKAAQSITWISLFFAQTLPFSLGGDPVRIWYMYKDGVTPRQAILINVVDRIFGFIALILVIAAGLAILAGRIPWPATAAGWSFVLLSGMVWLSTFALQKIPPIAVRSAKLAYIIDFLRDVGQATNCMLVPRMAISGFGLSFISTAAQLLSLWCVAHGLGLTVSLSAAAILLSLATLTAILPISVGGWGVREAIMVAGFGLVGMQAEHALAISVLTGMAALLGCLPGFLIWLNVRR